MNKYGYLLFFVLGNASLTHAAAPLEHIGHIECPNQEQLNAYNPERVGQNKLRYWFGGKYFQWTPMAVDVTMAAPYTQTKNTAIPQLQATQIQLIKDASGDWITKCSYQVVGGYGGTNDAVTSLTVRAKECTLDSVTKYVSCRN